MKKLTVKIMHSGKNFGAFVPDLPGCVATGVTPAEIKQNIAEAISFHIESSLADNDPLPKWILPGKYELAYVFDVESLLNYYKGIFSNAGIERITGIKQAQISHYVTGLKKPRPAQAEKIKTALHNLGRELLAIDL